MILKLKKSLIKDWWVAKRNHKMGFYNILSEDLIKENLLVVGFYGEENDVATSCNPVVKITKKGVITAKGSFYPFEEAHPMYLQFLIEVNKVNTLIAYNWEWIKTEDEENVMGIALGEVVKGKLDEKLISANISNNQNEIQYKEITFDFTPNKNVGALLCGYSRELSSRVILSTFSPKMGCLILGGVPDSVKKEMYATSFITEGELQSKMHELEEFLLGQSQSISVILP